MTTAPLPHHAPAPPAPGPPPGRLPRWAVGLSLVSGVAFVASIAIVALAYAVGAEGAVEDTWFGAVLAVTAFAGLLGSLAAFVLAVAAKVRRERWSLLWLPLGLLPAAIVFLALGEAFLWE